MRSFPRTEAWFWCHANLAWAAARCGNRTWAALLYEQLAPYAAYGVVCGGASSFWGTVAHWLGLLATTLGRFGEAEAHLSAALARHERMGARPWTARSQCELARLLTTRDGPGDAARARFLCAQASRTAADLELLTVAADVTAVRPRGAPG